MYSLRYSRCCSSVRFGGSVTGIPGINSKSSWAPHLDLLFRFGLSSPPSPKAAESPSCDLLLLRLLSLLFSLLLLPFLRSRDLRDLDRDLRGIQYNVNKCYALLYTGTLDISLNLLMSRYPLGVLPAASTPSASITTTAPPTTTLPTLLPSTTWSRSALVAHSWRLPGTWVFWRRVSRALFLGSLRWPLCWGLSLLGLWRHVCEMGQQHRPWILTSLRIIV